MSGVVLNGDGMTLLTWVGDDETKTATLGTCTFTISRKRNGFALLAKGTIPPDGGFEMKAKGTNEGMLRKAEGMAEIYLKVTSKSPSPSTPSSHP